MAATPSSASFASVDRRRVALIVWPVIMCALVRIPASQAQETSSSDLGDGFTFTRSNFRDGSSLFGQPPVPPAPPSAPSPPSLPSSLVREFERALGESATSAPSGPSSASNSSSLVWQPLPLRATFRPLQRPPPPASAASALAETAAASERPVGLISERSVSFEAAPTNAISLAAAAATAVDLSSNTFSSRTFFPTRESSATSTISTTTRAPSTTPALNFEPEDELPTRQPMLRFRPVAREPQGADAPSTTSTTENQDSASSSSSSNNNNNNNNNNLSLSTATATTAATNFTGYQISAECFECICEASTNCNPNSKCQTSDVRHTRCGMFLISYDQWLATGLSRELVSREALARDAAADERAFYECVTERECAQRLLAIYGQRHQKDCDRDSRLDCYDLAAVHHSGMDQCASESLLDSQYWSDFNACFGFGR